MKKIIIELIFLIFIMTATAPVYYAVDAEPDEFQSTLVAFGDSLSYGYGLEDREHDGCVYLAATRLGYRLENYAVNGLTSDGLKELLSGSDRRTREDIVSASVITVTIGSNDLLVSLEKAVGNALDPRKNDGKFFEGLSSALTSDSARSLFEAAIAHFGENLSNICGMLKSLNPHARIVIAEIYNPYYGITLFDFSKICDDYIRKMNELIHADSETSGYRVAKVYEPFNRSGVTNVSLSTLALDPHPNRAGHEIYARALLTAIDSETFAEISETESEALSQGVSDETVSETTVDSDRQEETVAGTVTTDKEENSEATGGSGILLAVAGISAAVGVIYIVGKGISQKTEPHC